MTAPKAWIAFARARLLGDEDWLAVEERIGGGFSRFGLLCLLLVASNDAIVGDARSYGVRIFVVRAVVVQYAHAKATLCSNRFLLGLVAVRLSTKGRYFSTLLLFPPFRSRDFFSTVDLKSPSSVSNPRPFLSIFRLNEIINEFSGAKERLSV